MSVSRQVGYWDCWKFFKWGKSDAWGSLGDSGEVVPIAQPADFDLEAMRQKVATADRVDISEDKRCIVDGIFILNTPNRTSFLQIGSAVERAMKNIALGSALLATAMAVSHRVVAKYPYIRLIALIGSMAVTCFALLRYWQAHNLVRNEQNHLWGMGTVVAGWRKECYSLWDSDVSKMHKCLQPFEGEALFKRDFLKWAGPYSALRPQTPQEKEKRVKVLFVQMELWQRKAQQLLVESCVGSSTLKDTLGPVFGAWGKFKRSFENREAAHRLLCNELLVQKDQIIDFLNKFLPGIVCVYQDRTYTKTDLSQMEKDKYEEYFFLACQAACKGTCLEEAVRALIVASTFFCLNSFYYDEARLLFEAMRQIVEKGEGTMPEVKDYFKMPQSQGSLMGFSIDLNEAFRDRARELVPTRGTQEEYLKFLNEIRITKSLS